MDKYLSRTCLQLQYFSKSKWLGDSLSYVASPTDAVHRSVVRVEQAEIPFVQDANVESNCLRFRISSL